MRIYYKPASPDIAWSQVMPICFVKKQIGLKHFFVRFAYPRFFEGGAGETFCTKVYPAQFTAKQFYKYFKFLNFNFTQYSVYIIWRAYC
jgi:hypothetical protein